LIDQALRRSILTGPDGCVDARWRQADAVRAFEPGQPRKVAGEIGRPIWRGHVPRERGRWGALAGIFWAAKPYEDGNGPKYLRSRSVPLKRIVPLRRCPPVNPRAGNARDCDRKGLSIMLEIVIAKVCP
jgi:hypothetical protein